MDMILMYDGLELGVFKFNTECNKLEFIKHDKIDEMWLPEIIRFAGNIDMRIVIDEWFKDRVFPSNRINLKNTLKIFGLKRYNHIEIAKQTRGSLMSDGWWIAMEENDSYTKNSARGKLNNSNYPYNSLEVYPEECYKWRI